MKDARREAVEWLERNADSSTYMQTILGMLAEPRIPAEPTLEMTEALVKGWIFCKSGSGWSESMRAAYRSLYAHLTAPVDDLEEIRRYGT